MIGEEYYRVHYRDYAKQNPPAKIDFYLDLVRRHVPPTSHLFELGVGLGLFLSRANVCYQCRGCDINPFAVREVRTNTPGSIVEEGSFECIPADPPPMAVIAWDVLEHIEYLDSALEVTHQRLAHGGVLIATVPVYDGPLGWLVNSLDHDPTHRWKWSRQKWLETLRRHEFEIVEYGGVIRYLVPCGFYLHFTRPQFLLRRIGSALYFVVRKPSFP